MAWSDKDKKLGMDRAITRRDFLDGMALTIGAITWGGFAGETAMAQTDSSYPPR